MDHEVLIRMRESEDLEEIEKRLGGFQNDELRKILVRAGAARFSSGDDTELWGLISRNRDDL